MNILPVYIAAVFTGTTLLTLLFCYRLLASCHTDIIRRNSLPVIAVLIIWLTIQSILSLQHVYSANTNSFPPLIMLSGILPPLLGIVLLFILPGGRKFTDGLSLRTLTYLHIVRIPVEIVLFWLAQNKVIPTLMTFEGHNLDILAGITAPLVAYSGLRSDNYNRLLLLTWNLICLGLLLNIVIHALLSAPSPIQQLAFDQPNIAILYFPFSWLPTFIVPVVLLSHLISIRQLLLKKPFIINNPGMHN